MFGKLKEKLKGWFTKSKETIEEKAELVKTEEKEEIKPEKKKRVSKKKGERKTVRETKKTIEPLQETAPEREELEKIDEIIEESKEIELPEIPLKFEVGKEKFEPDLERIKEGLAEEELQKEPKKSFFQKIRSSLAYKITPEEFSEIFGELEMLLLENNVALEVIDDIRKKLSEKLIGKEIRKAELEKEIRKELKNSLNEILIEPDNPLDIIKEKKDRPFVILFFGINGTGKTTSIAKIAYFLRNAGFTTVLAAGDTFRAASIEQLEEHASRLKVPIIKHDYQADPAAVGFDAIKYAKNHKIDVVLIDTAGRMHTKTNLIVEMEKICRVTNPDLKIFVAESIAGNDATEQAKTFNQAINIDGSILTKADVDEKGGTILSVSHATHKPIFYLGTGQNYKDLELFNKQRFLDNLIG